MVTVTQVIVETDGGRSYLAAVEEDATSAAAFQFVAAIERGRFHAPATLRGRLPRGPHVGQVP